MIHDPPHQGLGVVLRHGAPSDVEHRHHEMISFEIRSSVRIPGIAGLRVTTTATAVRDVTIESSAWRRESRAVT